MAFFARAASRYNRWLSAHPIKTKATSAASLAAGGDLAAQALESGQSKQQPGGCSKGMTLDLRRTLSFAIFGGGYTGCFNHVWLGWLSRRYSQPGLMSVLKKQAWQHGALNPCIFVPSFFFVTGAIRGSSFPETAERVRLKYWETLKAAWSVWGPATAVMFAIVPERHQVLYTAVVSLGWNVILSLLSNRRSAIGIKVEPEEQQSPGG